MGVQEDGGSVVRGPRRPFFFLSFAFLLFWFLILFLYIFFMFSKCFFSILCLERAGRCVGCLCVGGAGGVLKLEQARYRERSLRRCYTSPDASTTTSAWGVCVCFDSLCTFSLRCSLAPIPFSSPSSLLVFSSLLSALLRCFLFSFLPSDACRTEPMPKILPLVCLGLFPSLPPSRSLLSLPLVL